MSAKRRVVVSLFAIFVLVLAGTVSAFAAQEWRYLKSNVHAFQNNKDIKASYAIYTDPGVGHFVVPVNTKVQMKKWRKGFVLVLEDGRNIYFEVHPKRVGMDGPTYYNTILTSDTEVDLSKFSAADRKGITDGKVSVGMTREGVRIAFGFPPPHANPDINAENWIFWRNRFGRTQITFNGADKVSAIK